MRRMHRICVLRFWLGPGTRAKSLCLATHAGGEALTV